ncbi:MAG: hypothetical protein ACRENP_07525 [Longimicrobiales bacterium]
MTRNMETRAPRPFMHRSALLAVAGMVTMVACSNLTDVEAPDVVQPDQLDNIQGAEAYTNAALASIYGPYVTFAYNSGLLSDEFFLATAFTQFADIDYRTQSLTFTEYGPIAMHRTRTLATLAIEARRKFIPTPRSRIGQMFALKGLVELYLGETSCNGTPLSEIENFEPVYGGPLSSDSMLKRALADFDSALVLAADSPRVMNYIRVAKGRALTNLGRYSEAALVTAPVPTNYVFNAELTTAVAGQSNTIWQNMNSGGITVADREGGNGLNFRTANDPRVPTSFVRTGTDGLTPVHLFSRYNGLGSAIPMMTGIEARLIEAEAALQANRNDTNPTGTGWLGILNTLRAAAIAPAMPALADPGSYNARVDLLFRERAFWLYATGHRLGDLRRLLRNYSRTQQSLWPVGAYKAGQNYGEDVVFIITLSEQSNPNGRTCTDKNP